MSEYPTPMNWDPRDFVIEDRYPKRNRKSKIENLSSLEEPEYINKGEKLTTLPYDIDEILTSPAYEHDNVVKAIPIEEFTLDYIKRTGLSTPLFFNVPPEQLGMRMPDPEKFTVDDVLDCIGGDRKIEVVEVYEQNGRLMKLNEFIEYYKKPSEERKELLNVLSLEFTSTRLAELASAPSFVTQIDWIDNVWPKELFDRQENLVKKSAWARDHDFSTYPKVQRYCLMSVARCFTDYHIDFGGTSVWYHILKGEKVFWLIEPTEENLKLYEEWILGGSNNSCFFGNIVGKCTRIFLKKGNTLVIPSGWIHCVYTPSDSLVFGGNFLHGFSIPMQIRVSRSEDRIKIGSKYRFPHFKQIFWCYIAQIVKSATGRIYQKAPTINAYLPKDQIKSEQIAGNSENDNQMIDQNAGLTSSETDKSQAQIQCTDQEGSKDVFYDDIGNAEDGSFTFNPIQLKFGDQATNFTPATNYNLVNFADFLNSLSPFEINGFYSLLPFAKRLLNAKQPEVVEGITRPSNLIIEFEALLNQIGTMDLLDMHKYIDLSQKASITKGFAKTEITNKQFEHLSLNVKLTPKKKSAKRQTAGSSGSVHTKKANKISGDKAQHILIDGLPLPTSAGTIPSDIVALGHKPIPSAWRRSSDMAKPPPTEIRTLKKKSIQVENVDNGNKADFSNPATVEQDLAFPEQTTSSNMIEEKKIIPRRNKVRFIHRTAAVKLVEVHDNSPELMHRSPLQRFTPKQNQTSNYNDSRVGGASFSRSTPQNNFPRMRDDERQPWRSYSNSHQRPAADNQPWGDNRHNYRDRSRNDNGFFNSSSSSGFARHTSDQNRLFGNAVSYGYQNSKPNIPTNMQKQEGPDEMEVDMDIDVETGNNSAEMEQPKMVPVPVEHEEMLPQQPMSMTVNELHHISQIMNNPVMDYELDQIPLPPSPPKRTDSNENNGNIGEEDRALNMNGRHSDPFTQVDELAELAQLYEQH